MHTFSLGPSGVGKSYHSEELSRRENLLFLEADLWPPADGIDHHRLRSQWDAFHSGQNPAPLSAELDRRAQAAGKNGVVLSFPGFPVLRQQHISASRGVFRVVYFGGSPGQCLDSFLEREKITGRGLDIAHWARNAGQFFPFLDSNEVRTNTIITFRADGTKRPFEEVYTDIQRIA